LKVFFGFTLSALDTVFTRQKDNVENGKPRNAGLPWTTELRAKAAAKFKQGCSVDELAESFARTNGAITSELVKQGLIDAAEVAGYRQNRATH